MRRTTGGPVVAMDVVTDRGDRGAATAWRPRVSRGSSAGCGRTGLGPQCDASPAALAGAHGGVGRCPGRAAGRGRRSIARRRAAPIQPGGPVRRQRAQAEDPDPPRTGRPPARPAGRGSGEPPPSRAMRRSAPRAPRRSGRWRRCTTPTARLRISTHRAFRQRRGWSRREEP